MDVDMDIDMGSEAEAMPDAPGPVDKANAKKPTLREIQLIQSILAASETKLGKTGVKERLSQVGPCALGLTCINKIIQKLKTQAPEEIVAAHGKGRGRKPTNRKDALVEKIAARLEKNNSTMHNSARKMAKDLKVSKSVVNFVTKKVLRKKVLKKVEKLSGARPA